MIGDVRVTKPRTNENKLRLLSLGWGVQSFTLGCMAGLGEIEPIDYAVNSDTGYESSETYDFMREHTPLLENMGVPVIGLQRKGGIIGSALDLKKIPAFVGRQSASGNKKSMKKRECTRDWKVRPQNVWTRAEMRRRGIALIPGAVEKLLGISMDEFERARTSDKAYIKHIYPLLDMRMSRSDCVDWLVARGLPVPPKSACVMCPFRSRQYWGDSFNRPGGNLERAIVYDETLRASIPGMTLYIHESRIAVRELASMPRQIAMSFGEIEPSCDSGHCFL